MYQGINGYFCDNVVYPDILQSHTNYHIIPSKGCAFLLVCIIVCVCSIEVYIIYMAIIMADSFDK